MSDLTKLVPRPSADSINTGLSSCRAQTLRQRFGSPRANYSQVCQGVTGQLLKKHITTGTWFGHKVTGLSYAINSLKRIETKIRANHPELIGHVGHQGMLCCRFQRGSFTAISNHSWGTAIDLAFDGEVDRRGDDMCQAWLLLVYPYFHEEGWYWGSEFKTEDSMHFELADETVRNMKI